MKMKSNSISDIQTYIQAELKNKYTKSEIRSLTNILFEEYGNIDSAHLLAFGQETVNESALLNIVLATEQLKKEKPIQQILRKTYFCDLCFDINEHVLIPRPETEELCKYIIDYEKKFKHSNIIDLCTGSGCIALSIKKYLNDCTVYAMDVSSTALDLAKRNSNKLLLKVIFVQGDLLQDFDLPINFDVIVSNPPYVMQKERREMKNNVLKYEPEIALFVEDGNPLIFYQKIEQFAQKRLNGKGRIYLEVNENLTEATLNLFSDKEYIKRIKTDIFGKKRFALLEKK